MDTIILEDFAVLEGVIWEAFDNPEVFIKVVGDNVVIRDCRFFHPRNDFEALIRVDGKNCIIDNCIFAELDVNGCCITLSRKKRLDEVDHLVVKNCLFLNGRDTKKNGAEAIRLGWSGSSLTGHCNSIIRDNRFENWSREIECISVKSNDNIIFNNEMMACDSTITLRHGKNNLVAHNVIDGKGRRRSGGIRVIDSGHSIVNNIIKDIGGDGKNRTGITLVNGKETSKLNEYLVVDKCLISENIFINCKCAMALGYAIKKNTKLPTDVIIESNTFDKCEEVFSSNKECKGLRDKSICENVCMHCNGDYNHKEINGIMHTDQVWYKLHLLRPNNVEIDNYEQLKDWILNWNRPLIAYGTHGIVPPPKSPPIDVVEEDDEEDEGMTKELFNLIVQQNITRMDELRKTIEHSVKRMQRLLDELKEININNI